MTIKNFLKNTRPLSWVYLIYQSEKNLFDKKRSRAKRENSNELIQYDRVQPWFEVDGDATLRLAYDLNESSIIFDVGGYKGEFARDIFCKYNSMIFIFEPLPRFYTTITNRFINNKKVRAFNFGLSDQTCKTLIIENNDASSTVSVGIDGTEISLVFILDFIKENDIQIIDLIKLNIEGGEYSLLESVIKDGDIKMFKNIQVQFHDFVVVNARQRMQNIQKELIKTHHLTYQFEFVWENWELNS